MQTEKLYEQDVTMLAFEATVLSCIPHGERYRVVLDRTSFFPEGGGQAADRGRLGDAAVLDVHVQDGVILHETDRPLAPGSRAAGEVDGVRRMDLTQQHSGEHIVSGIVHRMFGYDNVGFHIGSAAVTLDFNGELTPEQLRSVERQANEAVWKDLPVHATYPPAEKLQELPYRSKKPIDGPVRIVEVPGYDICACCGTHVRRTGEIGLIKVIDCIRYKGGVRVSILCGARALQDACQKQESVREIGALLCTKSEEAAQGVRRLLSERDALREQLNGVYDRLFERLAADVPAGAPLHAAFVEGLAPAQVRRCAAALAGRARVAAAFSPEGEGCRFALCAAEADVRPIGKALLSALGGRGGGPRDLVQGSLQSADEAAIRAALEAAMDACAR
ncbi:alanine--tRNA ligase-related protein [Beduinella massiliensis]|uniref:alanine--tRNA ligase-related protein n=1 Tax=Beduinella massiliensis TaxID=1852363 RepID=UPI000C83C0A3